MTATVESVDPKLLPPEGFLANRQPVIAGVREVPQSEDWKPDNVVEEKPSSMARGLLDPGVSPATAAINRAIAFIVPFLGMGEPTGGNRIHVWYNRFVENLGAWAWAWCCATTSWMMSLSGANNIWKDRAYVPFAAQDAMANGTWFWGSSGMRRGDIPVYNWGGAWDRNVWSFDHIGAIVEYQLADGTWSVIEGNISDSLRRIIRDSKYIVGFIRPDWANADGIIYDETTGNAGGSSTPAPTPTPAPAPSPNAGQVVGPKYPFPLPSGYWFGKNDGSAYSVSGKFVRWFSGQLASFWIKEFANQLARRGWSVGEGKRYLSRYGNDGEWGDEYDALCEAFQVDQGLTPDKKCGRNTWTKAFFGAIT